MPRYDWRCEGCASVTEVVRRMSDSGVGPHRPCQKCGASSFKRKVSVVEAHIPGGRSENGTWPLRVPKLEKVALRGPDGALVRDQHGRPMVAYQDVVFRNKREQDEYLARTGRALMMDGEADSTKGSSEKSFYDQEHSPPSDFASTLESASFFVEDPSEVTADVKASVNNQLMM